MLVTRQSVHEDVGMIPGLASWGKDLASPQAAESVTAAALIWAGHFHMLEMGPWKETQ